MKTKDFIRSFRLESLEGLTGVSIVVGSDEVSLQFDGQDKKLPLQNFIRNNEIDHDLIAAEQGNFEMSRVPSQLLGV